MHANSFPLLTPGHYQLTLSIQVKFGSAKCGESDSLNIVHLVIYGLVANFAHHHVHWTAFRWYVYSGAFGMRLKNSTFNLKIIISQKNDLSILLIVYSFVN